MKPRTLATSLLLAALAIALLVFAPVSQDLPVRHDGGVTTARLLPLAQLGLEIDSVTGAVRILDGQQYGRTRPGGFVREAFAQDEGNVNSQLELVDLQFPPPGSTPQGTIFPIIATFKNTGQENLSDLFFRVAVLRYVDGGGSQPELANADRGGTGVGAERDVSLAGGVLPPGGTFDITFDILLPRLSRFYFFVDAYSSGVSGQGGLSCLQGAPWPELLPQALTSDPAQPYEWEGATVAVEVVNRGDVAAANVLVVFRGDGQEFAREIIAEVPPCATVPLAVYWPGGDMGPHIIEVEVDPDGAIPEGTRENNTAQLEIFGVFELIRPWEPSDLILSDFQFSPARPQAGESISLRATAMNDGDGPLADVLVRFMVDGEQVDQTIIAELAPDGEATVNGTWTSATPGRHYLAAQAQLPLGTPERDPTNNTVGDVVHVGGEAQPLPDLVIEDLILSPGSIHATAIITNIGWAAAVNLPVTFVMDNEPFAQMIVDNIGPAETHNVEAVFPGEVTAGEHTVWVELDPGNVVTKAEAPTIFSRRYVVPTADSVCLADAKPWVSLGPSNLTNGSSGRVDSVAIDPNNTNIMYVGTPTGGIFKTTNGGTTSWNPKSDFMPSLSISALLMDPNDHDIIYAGSGAGLYKTTDGGINWSVFTDTSIGTAFRTLIVNYTNSTDFVLYAGTNKGVWRYNGTNKYLKKASAADWKRIRTGEVDDLLQHPTNHDLFYVSVFKGGAGIVYRSKPGGAPTGDASWDPIFPPAVGRIHLAMSAGHPNVLYAAVKVGKTYLLYRSTKGGDSWQQRASIPQPKNDWLKPTATVNGSGWENLYNAYVAVDPVNSDIVYMGHIGAYRSDDGGQHFKRIAGVHDDQHGFAFHPGNSQIIYFMGDGGIFKCTGRGASCSGINNELRSMMFYDIALSRTFSSVIIGGTQDNGTIATLGTFVWHEIRGGDGRYVAIDPQNADIIYSQHQYLGDTRKAAHWLLGFPSAGNLDWRAAPGLPPSPAAGVKNAYTGDPYFIVHPANPNVLLAAGPEVYRHTKARSDWTKCPNCDKWVPIGPNAATAPGVKGDVKRIAVDATSNIYYAGMSSGQIWRLAPGGTNWEKIFTHPTGRGVTGLVVDPSASNRLWVTFGGTGKTHGPNRVWMLERIEINLPGLDIEGWGDVIGPPVVFWNKINITANLSSELALGSGWRQSNMIAVDPYRANTVYVATDKGVYRGTGVLVSGKWSWNWQPYNCGLPWVNVTDLEVSTGGSLYAATYGRGLWVNPIKPIGE